MQVAGGTVEVRGVTANCNGEREPQSREAADTRLPESIECKLKGNVSVDLTRVTVRTLTGGQWELGELEKRRRWPEQLRRRAGYQEQISKRIATTGGVTCTSPQDKGGLKPGEGAQRFSSRNSR